MKWSEIFLKTLKEKPQGAETPGHILLLRGGYIFPISAGLFIYNTLFIKSLQKFSDIVREELEKEEAREILMPMVQPKELWMETGRWDRFQDLLLKMKNRSNQDLCLGPTHEEVVTAFARSGVSSWRDMPFNIYQIQTKYRDEIRPRFGLLRAKEFIMKDSYSFDRNTEEALKSYNKMFKAYSAILKRLDVKFVVAEADTGNMGGKKSEEFHILAERGEDVLLVSDTGDFAANREICPSLPKQDESSFSKQSIQEKEKEEFATPGVKTIEALSKLLKYDEQSLVKIVFVKISDDKKISHFAAFLCQGNDEINLLKAQKAVGSLKDLLLATPEEVKKITGAWPGSCGPLGLSCSIYVDHKLKNRKNFVTGANKTGFHLKNVNFKDFKVKEWGDFCYAREGDLSPDNKGFLKEQRGIEVGHLFYLSDTYSRPMNLKYSNSKEQSQYVEMGCYGMGITRTLQAVVEQSHDEKGIVWPLSIAPFAVHICLIDPENKEVLKALSQIEENLKSRNLDYFIDDRKERPGVKFKDADLLGMPFRINIGVRDIQNSQVELVKRKTGYREKVSLNEFLEKILKLLK